MLHGLCFHIELFFTLYTFAINSMIGMRRIPAGRIGEAPSTGLSASLNAAGFKLGRLQTGTPARLDKHSIDFSRMEQQNGDEKPQPFSFAHREVDHAVSFQRP
jgi:tRNA uridine 5-carboxymethylaminomethyl modification enzyme